MHYIESDDFTTITERLTALLASAPAVEVGEWQSIKADIPQLTTIEVEDVSFELPLPKDMEGLIEQVMPNMPWAEEHFQERVSGIPYNPPPSHVRWPFAQRDNDKFRENEQFSHTYPERIWPQFAGKATDGFGAQFANRGIRYDYGDLNDLITILKERPGSRQAYLPIWFPEDLLASVTGDRVPCTLGYHFLIREGKLKIVYYIRSCDFYRHFRDDVYMAARLAQFVAGKVAVEPARLVMHISSLHIFEAERPRITTEHEGNVLRAIVNG